MSTTENNTISDEYPLSAKIVCLGDFLGKGKALSELLSSEKEDNFLQYIIPFYQRQYEWQWKDTQLKGLFESFVHCDENEVEIEQDYVVFGTIQLNETQDGLEIIDGQQRLTSFWLFIKALEKLGNIKTDIFFSVKNYISPNLDYQFNNYCELDGGRYYENFSKLEKEIKPFVDNGFIDPIALKQQLISHVLFSVVITTYNDNIGKTIKLFDSMNTKGLDLDTKDVFKIRYYDYLKGQEKKTAEEIFNCINGSYEKCRDLEEMYQISENDLLDTFKLWILVNARNDQDQANLAKKIKATPQLFFVEERYKVWDSPAEYKGLDAFCNVAETIYQFQKCMIELDKTGIRIEAGITGSLLCTYELLRNCGYWYFRNFMFVFAHNIRIHKEKQKLEQSDVIEVLKKCGYIWKFCSIIKTEDLRVVNGILNHLFSCCSGANNNIGMNLKSYDKTKFDSYINSFKNVICGEVFNNRQCRFFVTLMYLNDCDNMKCNWKSQKRRLFYEDDKKNKYEIEHIGSRAFQDTINGSQMNVHHIGNLVFLSARVNKALGQQTADNNQNKRGLLEDFSGKVADNRDRLNYRAEVENVDETDCKQAVNIGIKTILDEINKKQQFNDTDSIITFLKERDLEKQEFLLSTYGYFID